MNIDYIHHDTRTDEPLQIQIKTLTKWQDPTIEEKDKEIERLNNIIDIKTNRIQQLMKRLSKRREKVDRLNNIINELEKDLTNILEDMYISLVYIDGRDYYSASLIPLEDEIDKLKELKEGK